MYTQPYQYAQQPVLPPTYPPQPPASYGSAQAYTYPQYPPPPNPHAMSSAEFRNWFMHKLSELVVNQKNIIHNLAFIANDNVRRMSQEVSESIEMHIRRAHPQIKLPGWYLLDSIAKNIGAPYIQLFSGFVARLFLESYDAVDPQTRSKMEEMLVTWRTGGRGGVELFGPEVQSIVENGVWSVPSSSTSSTLNRPAGPSRSQVLTELEVVLAQTTRALEVNPYDKEMGGRVETLSQLRTLVQASTLTPDELSAIATQLRNLARATASAAPPLPPMAAPQSSAPAQMSYASRGSYAGMESAYPTRVNVSSSQPTNPPPPSLLPGATDISALFQNLVKAGVVAAPATPAQPSNLSLSSLTSLSQMLATGFPSVKSEPEHPGVAVDRGVAAEREYERTLLSLQVPLTTAGLQKDQPQVIAFLYDRLPLQCKQCAQRFPDDGAQSKKRYEDHLDLHFRQNLKNATGSRDPGRGFTRSWFVGKQDFLTDLSGQEGDAHDLLRSPKDKGKARELSPTSGGTFNAERDAKLRASFVVVPSGDEAKPVKCPICKERMTTEFLEDEEEWVWRNAVSIKGKVYHATCHADAVSATTARLRHEGVAGTGRSRSATPDLVTKSEDGDIKPPKQPTPIPSALSNLKRKASYEPDSMSTSATPPRPGSAAGVGVDSMVKMEDTGSPRPNKKLAIGP